MKSGAGQLNGWKEIAVHMKRSVRCVQRWERTQRLPVRRHAHVHGPSVYAFREELDAWWQHQRPDSPAGPTTILMRVSGAIGSLMLYWIRLWSNPRIKA